MRYVAAYMLAVLGGNDNPTAKNLADIMGSVGIDCDGETAIRVVNAVKGKSIDELIEAGRAQLATMPSGGGAAAAAPAAAAGEVKEEKKEEAKKEESEEEDEDMGFGLFD